jgi:hypothetical protein
LRLEDHLDLRPQRPEIRLVHRSDIGAVIEKPAGRRLDEADQRPADRGLAGAGLADDRQRRPARNDEVDAFDNLDHRRRPEHRLRRTVGQRHPQALQRDQRRAHR